MPDEPCSTWSSGSTQVPQDRLTTVVDAVRLPPALVSPSALRRLRRVTDRLPVDLSNRLYFECRLASDAPQVDLVIAVESSNRAVLTRARGCELPATLRAHPAWRGVIELFEWWARGEAAASVISDVWLEFDAVPGSSNCIVPCVFLAFPRHAGPADVRAATLGALARLRGGPFNDQVTEGVAHAMGCLPASARVAYAGLMCPRDLDAVRLCIANVKRQRVRGYLREIGWPGDVTAASDAVQTVACGTVPDPLASIALLHVDAGARTGPRLGVEICFERSHQLRGLTRERDLLDRLCTLGLSAADKRDALLAWPGHSLERFPHQCRSSIVVRRVNGIKLVHVDQHRLEAKAYLTVFHQLRAASLAVR